MSSNDEGIWLDSRSLWLLESSLGLSSSSPAAERWSGICDEARRVHSTRLGLENSMLNSVLALERVVGVSIDQEYTCSVAQRHANVMNAIARITASFIKIEKVLQNESIGENPDQSNQNDSIDQVGRNRNFSLQEAEKYWITITDQICEQINLRRTLDAQVDQLKQEILQERTRADSYQTESSMSISRSSTVAKEYQSKRCTRCSCKFGLLGHRRHHCRSCGRSFCHSCSSKTVVMPHLSIDKPARCCQSCYDGILEIDLRSAAASPVRRPISVSSEFPSFSSRPPSLLRDTSNEPHFQETSSVRLIESNISEKTCPPSKNNNVASLTATPFSPEIPVAHRFMNDSFPDFTTIDMLYNNNADLERSQIEEEDDDDEELVSFQSRLSEAASRLRHVSPVPCSVPFTPIGRVVESPLKQSKVRELSLDIPGTTAPEPEIEVTKPTLLEGIQFCKMHLRPTEIPEPILHFPLGRVVPNPSVPTPPQIKAPVTIAIVSAPTVRVNTKPTISFNRPLPARTFRRSHSGSMAATLAILRQAPNSPKSSLPSPKSVYVKSVSPKSPSFQKVEDDADLNTSISYSIKEGQELLSAIHSGRLSLRGRPKELTPPGNPPPIHDSGSDSSSQMSILLRESMRERRGKMLHGRVSVARAFDRSPVTKLNSSSTLISASEWSDEEAAL